MAERKIDVTLNSIRAVGRFTSLNSTTDCEVSVYVAGEMKIPGDSIMGLFAINLLKPLKVVIKADTEKHIQSLLEKYTQENIEFTESEVHKISKGENIYGTANV